MKKLSLSIIGAALLAVVAFTSYTPKTTAQPRNAPSAAVFGVEMSYANGREVGYIVAVVSKGRNCPDIQVGSDLAPAIEQLLSQGFEITTLPGFQFLAIRR